GGLFPETHQALLIQKLLLSPLGPLINKLTTRRRFDISVSRCFGENSQPSKEDLDGFWTLINYNNGRHIFHNLISYMSDRKTHRSRWVAALKDAKMPLGLINGSVDPVSGAHMIAHYKDIIGEPDFLRELADIGHYPQVEDADAVTKFYLEFLSQL
ncbi:MAG: alpha/beta fold hydrolase, partial [Maricaulaceae bacterium]